MAATIKDVAKIANVSVSTVSRVINNERSVKPETIQIVQNAIKACNYVPNSFARGLKSNSSRTIGLLVSDISNSHFTVMAKKIETTLRENDFNMIICSTDEDADQEMRYINHLMSQQIDGLILNTTGLNNEKIINISQNLPIVLIERRINGSNFQGDYVSSNNRDGIRQLTSNLLRLGHRKIAFINCEKTASTGQERFKGFSDAMTDIGMIIDSSYPYRYSCDAFSVDNGFCACSALMQLDQPPTAIIAANNTLAIGALQYLRRNNIRIPDDVSFLSYGNIENSELFFVALGHATLNPVTIAEKAADFILSRIKSPALNNRESIFEPMILLKSSTKSAMTLKPRPTSL